MFNGVVSPLELLCSLYQDRHTIDPEMLILRLEASHISQHTAGYDRSFPYSYHAMGKRFMRLLLSYLRGVGHPTSETLLLTNAEIQAAVNNTSLRASLFVQAVTSSKYLPLDPDDKIKV